MNGFDDKRQPSGVLIHLPLPDLSDTEADIHEEPKGSLFEPLPWDMRVGLWLSALQFPIERFEYNTGYRNEYAHVWRWRGWLRRP